MLFFAGTVNYQCSLFFRGIDEFLRGIDGVLGSLGLSLGALVATGAGCQTQASHGKCTTLNEALARNVPGASFPESLVAHIWPNATACSAPLNPKKSRTSHFSINLSIR